MEKCGTERAIAHVKQGPDGHWAEPHDLEEHLQSVASMAGLFARSFGNEDWARIAGLWHDFGKFLPGWQGYLKRKSGFDPEAHIEGYGDRPNHSTAGAVLALTRVADPRVRKVLPYLIAGHHAGLPDWNNTPGSVVTRTVVDPLEDPSLQRLDRQELDSVLSFPGAQKLSQVDLPRSAPAGNPLFMKSPEQLHLWIRMLYSCLVDADFLDTEHYMSPEQATQRSQYMALGGLKPVFDAHIEKKQAGAVSGPVNRLRQQVLSDCRDRAADAPGLFSLTVPTGGGKTLSSLAFALDHAVAHGKSRIIMAIPYTSIIEQTASVYAEIFGQNQVLEHHSNLDADRETALSRLASENWDAPLIVTTNVQLFESLMAAKSSSNRKLHNLVNSILILDEAQMLPTEYYRPILSLLQGLVDHFGVTVVLCTATQPVLVGTLGNGTIKGQSIEGLRSVREIIRDPLGLARDLKRVEVEFPALDHPLSWVEVAESVSEHPRVLVVVNTRGDARELHSLLPPGTFHLSANLCGEERSEIIAEIKERLSTGHPIRVVSTQLVEAGVDLDFPVVYRALAGLDSIAQAAGRCNREGRLDQLGRVIVFVPPRPAPKGLLRKGEDATKAVLSQIPRRDLNQELFTAYFREFQSRLNGFDAPNFDKHLVEGARDFQFQFRTFADHVRLIDDRTQQSIVVLYAGKRKSSYILVEQLRTHGPNRILARKLQRFVVNISQHLFRSLKDSGCFEEVHGYFIQSGPGLYRPGVGFMAEGREFDAEMYLG